jgi:hypothetical protein
MVCGVAAAPPPQAVRITPRITNRLSIRKIYASFFSSQLKRFDLKLTVKNELT